MARTFWVDTLHNDVISSGGQLLATLVGQTLQELRNATILRTIVCHDYSYAVHDSGEGAQIIDVGIGITSQEAFAAGVVPDPVSAGDVPTRGWMYRCRHKLHGFAADQPAVDVRTVYRDLRGKRKLENGEAYIVIDNTASSGAASSVQVIGITRLLLMLPGP